MIIPPLLIHKLFRYRKFSETQIRRVPLRNFSALWDKKKFDTKSWHNSLKHKIFRYPKLVTHWRVPLRNFSALWDNKFSVENRDIPLLGIKFFDTRIFLKHRRVPRRYFSALWDESVSTENRDTLSHKV